MVLPTRRRLLVAGCGTVCTALFAGCADREQSEDEQSEDDANGDEPNGNEPSDEYEPGIEEPLTELSVETVRFEADVDRLIDHDDADDFETEDVRLPYISEPAQLELIDLRSEPIEDVSEPLSFLRDLEYDESTGLLVEHEVDACRHYQLQYVEQRNNGDGVRTQFCRTTRDADVECDIDTRHIQLTMVELPFGTDTSDWGSGSGQSDICRSLSEDSE